MKNTAKGNLFVIFGEPLYLARVDGDGPDNVYRAACEMTTLCGVRLEG